MARATPRSLVPRSHTVPRVIPGPVGLVTSLQLKIPSRNHHGVGVVQALSATMLIVAPVRETVTPGLSSCTTCAAFPGALAGKGGRCRGSGWSRRDHPESCTTRHMRRLIPVLLLLALCSCELGEQHPGLPGCGLPRICPTTVPNFSPLTPPSPTAPTGTPTGRVAVISGELTHEVKHSAHDLTYDLRKATSVAYPMSALFPFSFSGTDITLFGGKVLGQEPRTWTWDDFGANVGHGTGYYVRADHMVFDHVYADNTFDCIQPRPGAGPSSTYIVVGALCSYTRDDGVEADEPMIGVIEDSTFFPHMGVSLGEGGSVRIVDSRFIFQAMPDSRAPDGFGHSRMFKFPTLGTYRLANVVVCYEETPLGSVWEEWPTHATYRSVTFVLGPTFSGRFDRPTPPGVTLSRDWSLCSA